MSAGRSGPASAAIALIGLLISAYLAWTRLAGGLPVCGPLHGCETVALSAYSELAGIPVAYLGLAFSGVLLCLALAWWLRADRRALIGLYGFGLVGVLFVAYLTYLELFVIGAICVWCASYAVSVVVGWIVAALALRRSSAA
jgi:uncharacterized membrane protein